VSRRTAVGGTVAFVVFGGPGIVAGLGPWWLTSWHMRRAFFGFTTSRWIGVAAIGIGFGVAIDGWIRFVVSGHGTPAPNAPPRHLVVGGLYRLVRNPMYVGIILLILGQALLFGSWSTVVYATLVAVVLHLFAVLYEERTLRRRFGPEYEAYRARVNRWVPRFR
jgi:protein-S-isoprenylcysteine O-methyltransferase Ste14